jgi:hypothetical protein
MVSGGIETTDVCAFCDRRKDMFLGKKHMDEKLK